MQMRHQFARKVFINLSIINLNQIFMVICIKAHYWYSNSFLDFIDSYQYEVIYIGGCPRGMRHATSCNRLQYGETFTKCPEGTSIHQTYIDIRFSRTLGLFYISSLYLNVIYSGGMEYNNWEICGHGSSNDRLYDTDFKIQNGRCYVFLNGEWATTYGILCEKQGIYLILISGWK